MSSGCAPQRLYVMTGNGHEDHRFLYPDHPEGISWPVKHNVRQNRNEQQKLSVVLPLVERNRFAKLHARRKACYAPSHGR